MQKITIGIFACLLTITASAKPTVVYIPAPKIKPTENLQRVLFVGNSFSYFNNGIQNHVANLVRAADLWQKGTTRYRLKTISGGHFQEHVPGVEVLLDEKDRAPWDAVVLQAYSNAPISSKHQQSFTEGAEALAALARKHQAQPVFFMTWGYKGDEQMTQTLASAYTSQANQLDALVVPVGLAFANAQSSHPHIELYSPDVGGFTDGKVSYKKTVKHPSIAGTYLAACMFYSAFYQQSAEGLPYLAGLDAADAKALQQAAWATYQQFYGNAQ